MNKEIKALDLYFSADCNLNCKYCYIYKNKDRLHSYNEEIINSITSGKYISNLKNKCNGYEDNISHIGLWGAEPTLNSYVAKNFLFDLFDYFKNVNKLFFSTNGVLGINGIKPFIESVREYNKNNTDRKITLEIQFSLDGPDWITENTRGIGVTNTILKTIDDTIKYSKDLDNSYIKIKTKPTIDMDFIKYMNQDINRIIEWYCLFDNLYDKYKEYDNEHLSINLLGYPTMVNPDIYTIDDGKEFAKFIKNIASLDESYFKYYKHPMILQPISGFRKNVIDKYLDFEYGYGACSAGRNSISFDKDGTIHSCHRFFNYMPCPEEGLDVIQSFFNVKSEKDICKLNLLNHSYHNNFYSRYEFFVIVALALAKYGQIDKIYLEDKTNLLLLFCSIESIMCHFGQAEETKDPFIAQTGYIKLMGNGALQECMKYIRRCNIL